MSNETLGWMVGLAVTVLPVAVCCILGVRQERRARALTAQLLLMAELARAAGLTIATVADAMGSFGVSMRDAGDRMRHALAKQGVNHDDT